MTDFLLVPRNKQWDIHFDGSDIVLTDRLDTAIKVSFDTDAQSGIDEEIPDGTDDRRGCWTDEYQEVIGDSQGSTVWTVTREKMVSSLLTRMRQKHEDAIKWMIEDGISEKNTVTVTRFSEEILSIVVVIRRPTGKDETYKFFYNWRAQLYEQVPNEV